MNKFYHGTSIENALQILSHGFSDEKETIWTCSDTNLVYMASGYNSEADNEEAMYTSFEASLIAASKFDSKYKDTVVFEFNIKNKDIETYIEDDDSCENPMYGCYQIAARDLNALIANRKITFKLYLYENSYNPYLRIFYLKNLDLTYLDADDELTGAINIINSDTFFIQDFIPINYIVINEDFLTSLTCRYNISKLIQAA